MTYQVDRTAQLSEAHAKSRFGQKASLQAAGVPTKQHNMKATRATKKTVAKKDPAKKSAVKKSAVKKSPTKKTTNKKSTSKKSTSKKTTKKS